MVDFARKCTAEAVAICGPSVPLQQIGLTIDKLCAEAGYGSAIQFTGHGIGSDFHTFPAIYHTGSG
jgi:methionyl aminopeptidase